MKNFNEKDKRKLASEYILQQYKFEDKTALEFYTFADNAKAHPINKLNKEQTTDNIESACELFFEHDELTVEGCFEADLLHTFWEFMHKLHQRKSTNVKLGGMVSKAVSPSKNPDRFIEAIEQRLRKAIGVKLDILFDIVTKIFSSNPKA